MSYSSLRECILDLEKNGHLRRISQEVDPYLEMAEIQRRVYANKGPALFFEKVKGSPFPAVSNLFGTIERSRFMFRDTLRNLERGKPPESAFTTGVFRGTKAQTCPQDKCLGVKRLRTTCCDRPQNCGSPKC